MKKLILSLILSAGPLWAGDFYYELRQQQAAFEQQEAQRQAEFDRRQYEFEQERIERANERRMQEIEDQINRRRFYDFE